MIRFAIITLAILGISSMAPAQKDITLEEIWKEYAFSSKSVPGFNFLNDGKHYTRLEDNKIQQYGLATGEQVSTVLDPSTISGFSARIEGYTFSEDESRILVETESEQIYRRSSRASFYVYDRKAGTMTALYPEGKQQYATFNPQADKVAFVHDNNLYFKDLANDKVVSITKDGEHNKVIYGATDWVYEEELGFARAFEWSPDGMRLGFYRFDESEVKEFTYTNYRDELYPEYVTFKYPKVGEQNSKVDVFIYDLRMGKSLPVVLGQDKDIYIPRIKWTAGSDKLCVMRLNRHQNHIELLLADPRSGETSLLLEEKNKYYISEEVLDNLIFLKNGKQFIWASEQDGWNHIYLYDMKGRQVEQVTKGKWEVTSLYGVDEKAGRIYYQAAENSPMERQVYSIGLDGKGKQALAGESGWNSAQFSSTFDYYVVSHSTANKPPVFTVFDSKGRSLRVIEENAALKKKMLDYEVQPVAFFNFKTSEGVALNGWMIKPQGFKENRQYPVFMFVYGGPGSQQVTDSWKGLNYWWFQMLAQKG
ncbi:MAG: DPP IV N-terminal domain-containing protein, partial [Phaeodactylibacter sp.]|nr:DPP IV N-terminal domain-containing protein [Phaeodactylibacter sp.]